MITNMLLLGCLPLKPRAESRWMCRHQSGWWWEVYIENSSIHAVFRRDIVWRAPMDFCAISILQHWHIFEKSICIIDENCRYQTMFHFGVGGTQHMVHQLGIHAITTCVHQPVHYSFDCCDYPIGRSLPMGHFKEVSCTKLEREVSQPFWKQVSFLSACTVQLDCCWTWQHVSLGIALRQVIDDWCQVSPHTSRVMLQVVGYWTKWCRLYLTNLEEARCVG